jgi:hypothetical protein
MLMQSSFETLNTLLQLIHFVTQRVQIGLHSGRRLLPVLGRKWNGQLGLLGSGSGSITSPTVRQLRVGPFL